MSIFLHTKYKKLAIIKKKKGRDYNENKKSFEQAICILLLIGTSEGPLKSHELSKKLDVSDSYLKESNKTIGRCWSYYF